METETAIGFVERKLTSERSTRAYAMRQSRIRLEGSLTPQMIDAESEIEKAYRAVTNASYGNHDSARASGLSIEEYNDWLMDQQKRLKDWSSKCPTSARGVVLDHLVFSFTFTDIGDQRAICRQTVATRYRTGLNEWCMMRGWGDQFAPE